MNDITNRVKENIWFEAVEFARHGTPMYPRGEQWAAYTAECVAKAEAEEAANPYQGPAKKGLTREQRLQRKQRRLAAKVGISYEKWLAIAKSLYKVDGNYSVISIARGPENEREFMCSSQIEAEEKIYKLMVYKEYDHFERDYNFAYVPENMEDK